MKTPDLDAFGTQRVTLAIMEANRGLMIVAATLLPLSGLIGCGRTSPSDNAVVEENSLAHDSQPAIPLPRREPPLDRAALLGLVAQAASAAAAGSSDIPAQTLLDGRPFEIRIRFGCEGPSPALREGTFGWSVDAVKGTLRVQAPPTIASDDPLAKSIAGNAFEVVEGFWLARPWLLDAVCPARVGEPAAADKEPAGMASSTHNSVPVTLALPVAQPWEKVGLAEFYAPDESRTGRRSARANKITITTPDPPIGPAGFDLLLAGRLRALPDQRVIACRAYDPDLPPTCIVSVAFDRAGIERANNGKSLAEWSNGQSRP